MGDEQPTSGDVERVSASNARVRLGSPDRPQHWREPPTRRENAVERTLHDSPFAFDVEVAYGDLDHLSPVSLRPPLRDYLRDLWQRRHFVWHESRGRFATQNSADRLGGFWLVARPFLDALFYWIMFGLVLRMSQSVDNFVAFVLIGTMTFQFTSRVIGQSTSVMRGSKAVIRAFSFPRASIPLALVVREMLSSLPGMAVCLVMIAVIPPHALPTPTWLLVPAVFAAQTLLNLGIALCLARLGSDLPDIANATGFVMRVVTYASGVIFPIDKFIGDPVALAIVELNPIYAMLKTYRVVLIDGALPEPLLVATLLGWGVVLTVVGLIAFWRGEETYARQQ